MIRSFADKETERIWQGLRSRRLPPDIQEAALRKLQMVEAAAEVTDLRVPPGNSLEALKRDRKGQWSIRINSKWRICFKWRDGHAEDVEICDYH
ncbi:MAG: type II toxin-antitoxin system RelE/ParE family toxin [Hyphomicrobiales bacterium]|jgi:proteic killer suppression protein|nr:type II toxin-antitoxin system RelE/ParE family toxin [Hyphomicrobiales bacterium]MBP9173679.1 type II toxin-antitoxin system RelE/ParE family toxin [Hyphomicrobiales bacterium]MCC7480588.1 type II toxin-antitoxin system RelE/ParE family toxin [Hyphomicrobiales bacterium]